MSVFPNVLVVSKISKNMICGGIRKGTTMQMISWLAYKMLFRRSVWLEHLLKDDIKLLRDAANADGIPLQTSVELNFRATQLEYALGIKQAPGRTQ